jgi:hypothetical protein
LKGEQLQLEMLANVNELTNQTVGMLDSVQLDSVQLDSVQGYERVKSVIIGQAYRMF